MVEYEEMTVAQLKDVLRERELPVSGKKAELIARLQEADDAAEGEISPPTRPRGEGLRRGREFFDESGMTSTSPARSRSLTNQKSPTSRSSTLRRRSNQPSADRSGSDTGKLSKTGWRKPKGKQSKQRMNLKYRSPMARIGYRKIASVRGLHPSGFEEVHVHKPSDLEGIDPERQAVRIGSRVGNRKRAQIHDRADDLGSGSSTGAHRAQGGPAMMITNQKRMAAQILSQREGRQVGIHRIWIHPDYLEEYRMQFRRTTSEN
ncbi:MAG: hypothetical protein Ct9H300mP30_0280 [Methanobacteriota archaeon]|nr:MAG: hypothetical protein Ct9H300mP30_0280 [Euryarchaeota archaeon]